MKGEALKNIPHKVNGFFKKNGATILTCTGAAGVVVTSIFTANATVKAVKALEEATADREEELTSSEKAKIVAPLYLPVVAIGAATIGCIFGANHLNKNNQAALVGAYGMLDKSYKAYKDKVKELYGDDANDKVTESFAKESYPRQRN